MKASILEVLKSAPVAGRAVGSAMMFASTSDTASVKAANGLPTATGGRRLRIDICNIIRV
jgi:hypothetical protein